MIEYEVIRITIYGDEEEDKALLENNLRYPELVRYVEDEEAVFIVNTKTGGYAIADGFFASQKIKKFQVTEWLEDD